MENSRRFIPTLTPTFEQWKSLPIYLTHHETSLQRRFGAVKLIPPTRWISIIKNPYELRHIKMYIKQEIIRCSHHSDVFYIQNTEIHKRRFMTYEEFKTIAENDTYRVNDTINDNIMDYFWSILSNNIPLYIPNIDDSLFSKKENVFNMTDLASLLKYYPKRIPGVTTPFLHLGMWSSAVGLHIDEHDLISLNYLHSGASKIWYIIHPSSYSKLEELVNKLRLFSDISSSCLSPLQHKSLLIKPSFLHLHSIEYYQIEQKLNELVLIFPGTYHFYFDTGFNISETIKYALPSWLQFQRCSPRLCSCSISSTIMINLNRRFFTTDIINQFQEEYLASTSSTCIDLSTDDDNNIIENPTSSIPNNQITRTNIETEIVRTTPVSLNLDQFIEATSSSSSSMHSHTPSSTELVPLINNQNEQEDIWNIFEQISQFNSESIQLDYNSTRFHPYNPHYQPYSSLTQSFRPTYPISSLCTHTNRRRLKRRKCYGCRQRGHLRNECPYFSH